MKISSRQVRAALDAYVNGKRKHETAAPASHQNDGASIRMLNLEHRMKDLPDERDTLVHALRKKILRGRYFVSSRDIVDALLGRLAADLLNQE